MQLLYFKRKYKGKYNLAKPKKARTFTLMTIFDLFKLQIWVQSANVRLGYLKLLFN